MDFRDNMNWPCRKSSAYDNNPFVPSPYEIFDMHKTGAYGKHTKIKYYELVKIYHPDRNGVSCEGLSQPERLERYRLIVLAHEILSDPSKRNAYDAYGAGWGARQHSATRHSRGYSSTTGQKYGQGAGFDNSPFGNATWEDWERWYRRNNANTGPQKQGQAYAGTYVSPNAFATFVIIAAILSGVLQATRANTLTGNMAEQQLAYTQETSRFMTQRAANQFDDHQLDSSGRVKAFLEKRDPTRYGLKEEEGEYYKKHFGDANDEELTPLGRTRTRTGHGVGRGER